MNANHKGSSSHRLVGSPSEERHARRSCRNDPTKDSSLKIGASIVRSNCVSQIISAFRRKELFRADRRPGRSPQESGAAGRAVVKNAFSAARSLKTEQRRQATSAFAYSALASRMGMTGAVPEFGEILRQLPVQRVDLLGADVAD